MPRFHLPLLLCSTLSLTMPGQASAQSVKYTLAGSLSSALQPALSAGITAQNVAVLGGFGLSARLLADVGRGGGLELSGLFDVPLGDGLDRLTFYTGPGLALTLRQPTELRPSITAGLDYRLNSQYELFAEASYRIVGSFRSRAGITYAF